MGDLAASGGSRSVTRAIASTAVTQAAVIVLTVIASVAQARLLGAAGRGDYQRFVNAGALAVLYLGFGLTSSVTYFVSSGRATAGQVARVVLPVMAIVTLALPFCVLAVGQTDLRFLLPHELDVVSIAFAMSRCFSGPTPQD